jgi:hypothetical protein
MPQVRRRLFNVLAADTPRTIAWLLYLGCVACWIAYLVVAMPAFIALPETLPGIQRRAAVWCTIALTSSVLAVAVFLYRWCQHPPKQ